MCDMLMVKTEMVVVGFVFVPGMFWYANDTLEMTCKNMQNIRIYCCYQHVLSFLWWIWGFTLHFTNNYF